MTDYVQNLDALSILTVEAGLSLFSAAFISPPYNFSLFLFGIYAQEQSHSENPPRIFSWLLLASAVLDFIWFFTHDQNGFIKAVSILILTLKVPAFFASHRGNGPISFPGGGETVWSMPGGFSSGGAPGGYQAFGDDLEAARPVQPPPHPPHPTQSQTPLPPPAHAPTPTPAP